MKTKIIILLLFIFMYNGCSSENDIISSGYLNYIADDLSVEILVPVYNNGNKIEVFFENNMFFFEVYCRAVMDENEYQKFTDLFFTVNSHVDSIKENINLGYKNFIRNIYSGNEKIYYDSIKNTPHAIVHNSDVWKEYMNSGLNEIIGKYLRKEKNCYYLSRKIGNKELNDLNRILFNNSFIVGFDDAQGNYVYRKYLEN